MNCKKEMTTGSQMPPGPTPALESKRSPTPISVGVQFSTRSGENKMSQGSTDSTIVNSEKQLAVSELSLLLGIQESVIRETIAAHEQNRQEYYSIGELAIRWRVSRGTVYNRLRSAGAKVLDFSSPGKRSKKTVHVNVILHIEAQRTRKLC
jgi:hypothetical protein